MPKSKNLGLYTLKEACELLKVHPQTLRQWDRKGILKAVRFGVRGDRRYRTDDIANLISKKQKNSHGRTRRSTNTS